MEHVVLDGKLIIITLSSVTHMKMGSILSLMAASL